MSKDEMLEKKLRKRFRDFHHWAMGTIWTGLFRTLQWERNGHMWEQTDILRSGVVNIITM